MELVAAVAKRKLASIDVVSMDEVPFGKVRLLFRGLRL
jgi:hypothetical protein